jgi:P2-related tail formation protein
MRRNNKKFDFAAKRYWCKGKLSLARKQLYQVAMCETTPEDLVPTIAWPIERVDAVLSTWDVETKRLIEQYKEK